MANFLLSVFVKDHENTNDQQSELRLATLQAGRATSPTCFWSQARCWLVLFQAVFPLSQTDLTTYFGIGRLLQSHNVKVVCVQKKEKMPGGFELEDPQ